MRFIALFALILSLVAPASFADTPLKVAVSIPPQKYFVEAIGGKHVQVEVLVPATAEPETYEPTPRQITALSQANLYMKIGVPLERAWLERFTGANSKMVVVDTTRGIERMPMIKGTDEVVGKSGLDPHVWLSPVLVRIQAMNIRDALIKADPSHAADYRQGYAKLAQTIDGVDGAILKTLSAHPLKQTKFIVFHPAFGYFAAAYGLTQVPIEVEGKEPGPKQLAELIDFAKKNDIKVVFIEPQFAQKAAKTIADAIGGEVVTIDPLQEDWPAGMTAIATALQKTLN
ncbi:MAG: ABC transporter substrate-binding protein [Halothiobacillus sp. 24-54-40]|jgi:zinc transport system substrate-binding protein|nr:MAG: ABC transporter substrate-binding protein [Halothiobacillus sp. 35-54-62]OYZ87324.1 MAG: ABC transporter substrate-binding protein [Halothiobacillus sp. 24-54-40]OZA80483.1 MAG: ABC transporter substrate-binding protein [Halothiobacillus sp. 39-53-45]HQS02394.1 zinc ABC transporter substrate-binding protein [Halothiobacillus sp.]HQS29304.1 zinc ABC transporter substrate-binding protein [Halothiobacillus sp.]